ncbi:MAG: citramalate synthase, partial [bacterium]
AEHFFDGYKSNPGYALKTLAAAAEAGADCLVLCDTNGGSLPMEVGTIVAKVRAATTTPLGIHTHNDGGCGVANALVAVAAGACHVQGTVNGYGERCGNSDLIQIIPNLVYKLKKSCMPPSSVKRLTEIAHTIAEVVNQIPDPRQPFVGRNVYTHKGGIHVSAVRRNPITYEHLDPDLVGNRRRVVVSEQSGGSNLLYKAEEIGIDFSNATEETRTLLREIKKLEHEGYQFEAAEGSLEVMMKKALKQHRPFFELDGFRVIIEKRGHDAECLTEATIKLRVGGEQKIMAAEGDGPVNALDNALRKALLDVYPALKKVHLSDFKVRVLNAAEGTAAKVRVLITTTDGKREWGTVGVSENIIQACWRALVDSLDYTLMKDMENKAKRAGNKKAKAKAKVATSAR